MRWRRDLGNHAAAFVVFLEWVSAVPVFGENTGGIPVFGDWPGSHCATHRGVIRQLSCPVPAAMATCLNCSVWARGPDLTKPPKGSIYTNVCTWLAIDSAMMPPRFSVSITRCRRPILILSSHAHTSGGAPWRKAVYDGDPERKWEEEQESERSLLINRRAGLWLRRLTRILRLDACLVEPLFLCRLNTA